MRICNVRGLSREWNGARSGERLGERGQHAEIGVERHAVDATHAERSQSDFMLEASERPFDRGWPR